MGLDAKLTHISTSPNVTEQTRARSSAFPPQQLARFAGVCGCRGLAGVCSSQDS